jgi:hypothetical protein
VTCYETFPFCVHKCPIGTKPILFRVIKGSTEKLTTQLHVSTCAPLNMCTFSLCPNMCLSPGAMVALLLVSSRLLATDPQHVQRQPYLSSLCVPWFSQGPGALAYQQAAVFGVGSAPRNHCLDRAHWKHLQADKKKKFPREEPKWKEKNLHEWRSLHCEVTRSFHYMTVLWEKAIEGEQEQSSLYAGVETSKRNPYYVQLINTKKKIIEEHG